MSLLLFAVVYLVMAYGCGDRMLALSVAMKSKEFREKVQGQRVHVADNPSQKSAAVWLSMCEEVRRP